MSAYEELAKLFRTLPSADDPEYRKWVGSLKKMVTDANAAAQDAGIAAIIVFLQNADIGGQCVPSAVYPALARWPPVPRHSSHLRRPIAFRVRRSRASVVPALIEKGLSAARPNTKAKAMEALLYYFEFENPDAVVVRVPPHAAQPRATLPLIPCSGAAGPWSGKH